jgi:tRNA G37 N-methylase Trm5
MTALAQGGYLHPYANQIYNAIGKLSLLAAKTELSTVEEFIEKFSKAKNNDGKRKALNELYDIVGRIVLNNLSSNNKDKDLSTEICSAIKSKFGLNPENHFVEDTFLIPFSDPSIYGHFFPTIISVINSKGIRRKNLGSGMVMAPSYSMF